MLKEVKYFVIVTEIDNRSEDRFELRKSFRPIVKFFSDKKDVEEWVEKRIGRNYDLIQDEFSGRCLAAWKGSRGRNEVKVALFEISPDGEFTMPKEWAIHVE